MRFILSLIFLILFCSPFFSKAQPVFSPGKIVLRSGDTLRGYVAELGEGKRYDRCLFKRQLEGEKLTYGPQDLRGFSITDKYYFESRTLEQYSSGDTIPVFMSLSLKGDIQVLKYKDRLFLETADGRLQEAPTRQNQKAATQIEKLQSGQLKFQWFQFIFELQKDCPTLRVWWEDQEKTHYELRDLIEIAQTYHICLQLPYETFGQDIPFVLVDWGLSVRLPVARLSFSDAVGRGSRIPFEDVQMNTLGIGVAAPIVVEPIRYPSHFSLYLTPAISTFSFKGEFPLENQSPNFDPLFAEISMRWIEAGLGVEVRYTLPNVKPDVTVQTGIRRDYFLNPSIDIAVDQYVSSDPSRGVIRRAIDYPLNLYSGQNAWTNQISVQDDLGASGQEWSLGLGYTRARAILSPSRGFANVSDEDPSVGMSIFFLSASYFW